MPFLNKLKKELEAFHISDRLQGHQEAFATPASHENTYGTQNTLSNSSQGTLHVLQNVDHQHNPAHQPYDGWQSFPEKLAYETNVKPSFHPTSEQVQQIQSQQRPSLSGHLSGDSNGPCSQDLHAPLSPYYPPNGQGAPQATSPQWQNQYHVGALNTTSSYGSQTLDYPTHLPSSTCPEHAAQQNTQKSDSSRTYVAAVGGFAAGGVAGYFIKDRIDARKAKKRHGRNASDFSDFASYPNMEVDLECNICDQVISGPYAHCKKCDDGDYDICRDCLAQGETCDGKGKHSLVKVYPKYFCDICDIQIAGQFYHCSRCNNSDWDICQACLDKGYSCLGRDRGETHDLTRLYIPVIKHQKNGRYGGSSSSSSSSSDSD